MIELTKIVLFSAELQRDQQFLKKVLLFLYNKMVVTVISKNKILEKFQKTGNLKGIKITN
jgi:hypothetical protein